MPTFGFSAFLKLLSLNPRPQRREIKQRIIPSETGYDFHRSLRLSASRLMIKDEGLEGLIAASAAIKNPAERRSLESGLRQLDAWRAANPGTIISIPPTLYETPGGTFKVSFTPDFGYQMQGRSIAVHVWNTGSVDLSDRMTYAALALVMGTYSGDVRPDDVAVLSLPDYRLLRLSDVPDQTRLADLVAANIDALFKSVADELAGPTAPGIRPSGTPGRPS